MTKRILKYKNLITILLLILSQALFLSLLSGCSKNNIINEDKFVKVYADLIIQQDTLNVLNYKTDTVKIKVFKRYNITAEDYKNTIAYYNQDPGKWEKFFDKVTAYVEELKKQNAK